MKSLFNLDSPVMQFLTRVADLMILNVVYLVFCIPIFTIGAATTALYRVMLNYEKDETANPARQFWRAFRSNLKPATILFLIMLIPIAFMIYYFMVIVAAAYSGSKAFVIICCVAVLLIMMLWSFLWPMQAQFENSIGNTIRNALLLSVGHLPIAVLMSVINLFPLLLLSFFSGCLPANIHVMDPVWLFARCKYKHKNDSEGFQAVSSGGRCGKHGNCG